MRTLLICLATPALLGVPACAVGQPPLSLPRLAREAAAPAQPAEDPGPELAPPLNVPTKTLGGKQLWTDLRLHGDWRIQCNSETKHCRLLDDRNVRRAWGSYAQCEAQFEQTRAEGRLRELPSRVVLLVHGLMGSRSVFQPLQHYLRRRGLHAMSFTYASTRGSLDDHARALAHVIDKLGPGVERIDFVAHSMGNLVVRRYLGMLAPGTAADRQVGAFVMLAPPNHGAHFAKLLCDNAVYRLVFGQSGQQLGDFAKVEPLLAIPSCPFGIVAGGGAARNPLLPGDDDLLVRIEETKLPGARDFIVVDSLHRSLPKHQRTMQYAHRFLTAGHFLTERQRKPLPAAAPRQRR